MKKKANPDFMPYFLSTYYQFFCNYYPLYKPWSDNESLI